jgi:hypothetical protein
VCFSTLMSKLGRLRKRDAAAAKRDERYKTLLAMLPAVTENAGPQAVSNTLHALAKLGERREGAAVLDAVEARADRLVEEFRHPMDISNTVWAFATLGRRDAPNLFTAIDARADWLVAKGKPQEIANTAWAFATLRRDAPKLLAAIDERGAWLVRESKHPQDVSHTAWAFATLGKHAPTFFSAIDERADWLAMESNPQAISNTAWAFATLGQISPKLFRAIDARAAYLIKEGQPQNISNTAWAFAKLGSDAPNFWTCLGRRWEAFAATADPQATCNTAWALAVAGRAGTNSGLLHVLWVRAAIFIFALPPLTRCSALAPLVHTQEKAMRLPLTNAELSQLVQVQRLAANDGVELQSPSKAIQQKMLQISNAPPHGL